MVSSLSHLTDNEIITGCIPGIRDHLHKMGWVDGEVLMDTKKSFVCAPLDGKTIFIALVSYQGVWQYVVASYLEKDSSVEVRNDFRLLTPEEVQSLRNRGMII